MFNLLKIRIRKDLGQMLYKSVMGFLRSMFINGICELLSHDFIVSGTTVLKCVFGYAVDTAPFSIRHSAATAFKDKGLPFLKCTIMICHKESPVQTSKCGLLVHGFGPDVTVKCGLMVQIYYRRIRRDFRYG